MFYDEKFSIKINQINLITFLQISFSAYVLQQRKQQALREENYGGKFKRLCTLLSWQHQFATLDYNVIDLDNKFDIEIDCLHGIRVLSTCWIIFIHTCHILNEISGRIQHLIR